MCAGVDRTRRRRLDDFINEILVLILPDSCMQDMGTVSLGDHAVLKRVRWLHSFVNIAAHRL